MRAITDSRRNEIVKLRKTGLSYAKIGVRLGISRERVREIFKGKPAAGKPDLRSKAILRASEVASLLGVHVNTVRRWSNTGISEVYRVGPRRDRKFRRQEVDAFLKE